MRKILIWIRNIWVMAGIVSLLIIVIGFCFSLLYAHIYHPASSWKSDPRIHADTYHHAPWVREYYKDLNASFGAEAMRWEPYVYWRRKAHQGRYININEEGLRYVKSRTNPPMNARSLRIFVFGGSTIWGTGVRDEFTIPALIQQQLTAAGINAEVINFGETGYVNTQEVIELLLQLQKNNIPDIVIFYDGENDVFSAYQNRAPGLPQNEFNRRAEFNLRQKDNALEAMALGSVMNRFAFIRFLQARFFHHDFQRWSMLPKEGPFLASRVKDVYENNLMIVDALAARYKFHSIFYWQPTIFRKMKLSMYEQREKNKGSFLEGLFKEVNDLVEGDERTLEGSYDFHDISGIFDNVERPLFIDWGHVGEDGNNMIAARMLKDILPVIYKKTGAHN